MLTVLHVNQCKCATADMLGMVYHTSEHSWPHSQATPTTALHYVLPYIS